MGVELKITDCVCFWLSSLSHLASGLGHSPLVKWAFHIGLTGLSAVCARDVGNISKVVVPPCPQTLGLL